jgi:hypothetical protein
VSLNSLGVFPTLSLIIIVKFNLSFTNVASDFLKEPAVECSVNNTILKSYIQLGINSLIFYVLYLYL